MDDAGQEAGWGSRSSQGVSAETQKRECKKDPTGWIVVGMEKQGARCKALRRTQWPVA